ncbi:molybdenum cofactor biosynthesis protein MoaE [Microbulbifer sp. CAU 1566]|uniref:molybdenum cofactor biosynthesis protein MoaE n=1 Tax=Microbulbifer sp. CAU 1566 TaxID=2933269 RepID=UPI0020038391|nr:molybdenum cofactor biosynthesis protein MoaE [Microbulbifer sp. CAU 1566]MCK7596086.1 molybdenum cofactor biosynthesis protein MoaE [Microbulbifer sp. CAU 1566]
MAAEIFVSVQAEGFDPGAEYNRLRSGNYSDGATAMFVGNVRDFSPDKASPEESGRKKRVSVLELEHYPGMAESALTDIAREAAVRWSLGRVRVIHRYGALNAGDEIVFVGTSSAHRQAALDACAFIMDYLKSRAPFWKKELGEGSGQNERDKGHWVEARDSDEQALKKW